MLRRRDDGHEIDTAAARLDVALIQEWLSTDAYWALGRSADVVARSIHGSICFGIFAPDGGQVGFARIVTDHATFAWLCDVYVARSARGHGLGTWLVQAIRDYLAELAVPRIVLATADAHGVYAKVGFTPFASPDRWMEIDLRPSPRPGDVGHT